jgi:hypothetical protein
MLLSRPDLTEKFMSQAITKYLADTDRSYQKALVGNSNYMPQQFPYQQ